MKDRELRFGIEASDGWRSVEPVNKGWSSDRKYKIVTEAGERLLLRLSDASAREVKAREYAIIEKYATLGFAMSRPVAFGICEGGRSCYMLLTWVEGCDLEAALPALSREEQYRLGREAGGILRRIHALPLAAEDRPSGTKREKKLAQLARYEVSSVRVPGDEAVIRFVRAHIDRIWRVAPAYLHGDFHPGNLIYREDGSIGVIDFNRWEVGDPYEDFYKLQSFGRELSVPYCVGQIDAYFDGDAPTDFWQALAVYVAQTSLYSICWAEPFGPKDVANMTRRCRVAFEDYDGFARSVPRWYEEWKDGQSGDVDDVRVYDFSNAVKNPYASKLKQRERM